MSTPPIRYAENGDIHLAYRVVGDAELDLVFVAGALTNLDVLWEMSEYREFVERLAAFARVIQFDKRGMGLSDRVRIGTLEERMDDVRAIMDNLGSENAVLMGVSEGGPMWMLFAATYPERTRGLVLCGAEVKEETTDDWPWGEATRAELKEYTQIERVVERWGKGLGAAIFAPSRKDDERLREQWGRLQVQSASPHDAVALMRMTFEIDVRHVVPSITTPTLVIHRTDDQICHVENARWLARNIEGAKYVELPGADHIPWIDGDDILDEIREFLTGVREPAEPERVLATVLFTDIVGSTGVHESWATGAGAPCSSATTKSCGATSSAFADAKSTRPETAFSQRPTGLRGRSGPARRSSSQCASWASTYVPACTPERSSSRATRSAELPYTWAHASRPMPRRERCSSSQTVKDLVAGSGIEFEDRGARELKGIPGEWRLYAVRQS
jgi:pimeloyl-ACP methyl ester carboxylesterase